VQWEHNVKQENGFHQMDWTAMLLSMIPENATGVCIKKTRKWQKVTGRRLRPPRALGATRFAFAGLKLINSTATLMDYGKKWLRGSIWVQAY
jgi:hypothetical protein